MMEALRRLFGMARGRAPEAPAAEAAEASPAAIRRRRLAARPEAILLESLAGKVLHGWLAGRRQALHPLVLNLRGLGAAERALLAEIMAAAALAGGSVAPERRMLAVRSLARLGAGEAEARRFAAALERPRPIQDLLAALLAAGLAPQAYAASLLAVDRRAAADRAWLGYLAARLGLPAELVGSLNRRYRMW